MFWAIFSLAIGVYCIFSGVKTLLTGKLSASEEKKIAGYSNKGARSFRLISAVTYLIGGVLVIGFGVLELLVAQKILADEIIFKLLFLAVAILIVVVVLIANARCKKMTDDE